MANRRRCVHWVIVSYKQMDCFFYLHVFLLVKILKFSKTLLKIGMIVHVTVGRVRVDQD